MQRVTPVGRGNFVRCQHLSGTFVDLLQSFVANTLVRRCRLSQLTAASRRSQQGVRGARGDAPPRAFERTPPLRSPLQRSQRHRGLRQMRRGLRCCHLHRPLSQQRLGSSDRSTSLSMEPSVAQLAVRTTGSPCKSSHLGAACVEELWSTSVQASASAMQLVVRTTGNPYKSSHSGVACEEEPWGMSVQVSVLVSPWLALASAARTSGNRCKSSRLGAACVEEPWGTSVQALASAWLALALAVRTSDSPSKWSDLGTA